MEVFTSPGLMVRKMIFSFLYFTAYLATAMSRAVFEMEYGPPKVTSLLRVISISAIPVPRVMTFAEPVAAAVARMSGKNELMTLMTPITLLVNCYSTSEFIQIYISRQSK